MDALVAYMEEHTLFARSQIMSLGVAGHDRYQIMWIELANKLNSIGTHKRTVKQWQDVSIIRIFFY